MSTDKKYMVFSWWIMIFLEMNNVFIQPWYFGLRYTCIMHYSVIIYLTYTF